MSTNDLNRLWLTLIFSRDEKAVSTGTIFLDDGISLDTVSTKQYEHYTLTFENNSTIRAERLGNHTEKVNNARNLGAIIIADAADLKDYDYACWTNKTGGAALTLTVEFNTTLNTLNIYFNIPLYHMKSIHMGNSKSGKPNLCNIISPSPVSATASAPASEKKKKAPKLKDIWKKKVESFLGLEPTQ